MEMIALDNADDGARRLKRGILQLVRYRFGPIDGEFESALDAIQDLERLKRIMKSALRVSTYSSLLDTL